MIITAVNESGVLLERIMLCVKKVFHIIGDNAESLVGESFYRNRQTKKDNYRKESAAQVSERAND